MENETAFKILFWASTIIISVISAGVLWFLQYVYHKNIRKAEILENTDFEEQEIQDNVFTELEKQIIRLTLQEYNTDDIASKLYMSSKNVEYYKKKLREKTNSKNFMGVVKYAYDNHILT